MTTQIGYCRARDLPLVPEFAAFELKDPLFPDDLRELQRDQMMTAFTIFVLSVVRKRAQDFALLAQIDRCLAEERRIYSEQSAHEAQLVGEQAPRAPEGSGFFSI